ncbi:hypothetical protein DL95DRAFT_529785 [Leptodontidium sp. 2 PMI_412]|nr:hypothetical protein DL95DRAFT_529785 [Leptodontidium sp. 2 PMI_412]
MERQSPALTVEDILSIYREWITKLFIEDEHTEAEIVGILRERHLVVKPSQIHGCLANWGLIPSASADTDSSSSVICATSDGWVVIPSPPPVRKTYEPPDQHIRDLYTKRPLPSVPATMSPKESPTSRPEGVSKGTCHLDPRPRTAKTVISSPERPSLLEAPLTEEQIRERLAAGVWSNFEMDDI